MKLFDILFGKKVENQPSRSEGYKDNLYNRLHNLLYHGDIYSALCALDRYNDKEIGEIAKACTKAIRDKNGRELMSYLNDLRWEADCCFKSIEKNYGKYRAYCGEDFSSLLAAGMCHCDGYIRMNCTRLMGEYPKYLPFILCMYNDWVTNVREAAEKAFNKAAPNADTLTVIMAYSELVQLRGSQRRSMESLDNAAALLKERISRELDNNLLKMITEKFPEAVRTKMFSVLISEGFITPEMGMYILSVEKGAARERAELLLLKFSELPREMLLSYIKNKKPYLRRMAAGQLIERYSLWEGAEEMLLDSAHAVRELMQYYLGKLQPELDIAAYCMAKLPNPYAIMALGEIHCADGEKIALEYIGSENAKTAAAAIYTLCKLSTDKYSDLYYKMISDPRPKAAKAAYKAFVSCDGSVSAERLYEDVLQSSEKPVLCRRYAALLCRPSQGIWEAMPWLIRLCAIPDENIQNQAIRTIMKRSCYVPGSSKLRNEIKAALSFSEDIPAWLKKDILSQIERK